MITILLSQVVLDVLEMLEKPLPSTTLSRITRLLDPWFRCWQLLVLQCQTGWQRLGQVVVEEGVVVVVQLLQGGTMMRIGDKF